MGEQEDLVFLLFCAYIYEKRTRDHELKLGEISSWLTESQKLKLDVEPCAASTIDFDDPDTPRIVDVLNTYAPEFPLRFIFSQNSQSYIATRINFQSPSTYHYNIKSGTLDVPFFHGGKVKVDGDVSFDTIVDLISNKIALTTEIEVSGSLVGCSKNNVKTAMKNITQIIYDNLDQELFTFSICGNVKFENSEDSVLDSIHIRSWTISFQNIKENRWCLKCTRS